MTEVVRVEKRELRIALGEHEAPASWKFIVVRFLRHEDGSEQAVPGEMAATAEEAAAHIGQAMVEQLATIQAKDAAHVALQAEAERLARERDDAISAVRAVRRADEHYDAAIKPVLARAAFAEEEGA